MEQQKSLKCGTCGVEGHDSQGRKELCLTAVVSRCQRMELQNQDLQGELAKLRRLDKCARCGHSQESHDSGGCLVWVEADAGRKCLCKAWTAKETRMEISP